MESKTIYRYPGSRPFEDTDIDRKLFFGRDREKDELLQKIIARKLVVLHAESGLGKTSLLNAGVSALLRERGFLPIKIRFNIANINPTQTVFSAIEEAAAQQSLDIEPGETETLWHYFKTAAFWSPDDTLLTPVLIFDQFEEFFDFHESKVWNEFVLQLVDLVHNTIPQGLRQAIRTGEPYRYGDEPPRVKIVISIRSDFMGQLDQLSSTIPEILENRYRLLALSRQQAREAITSPAQIQDEQMFSRRFRYSEGALDTILNYLSKRRERGGMVNKDEVESFQLQLLCQHIETNILEKIDKVGIEDELVVKKEALGGEAGMHKVFQNFYENQLIGLKPALNKRRVRRLCEKGLISASDRRLSLEEEVIEKQYKVSHALLAQLVNNRLLRAEKRVGSVYYELSHDSLVNPIQLSHRQRRTTIKKYALLLFLTVIIVDMAILTIENLKQNKLDKLFKEAVQLTYEKKNDQAIVKYFEILDEDPKNIIAIVKTGELLSGEGKYEDAVQLYIKAINDGVIDKRIYASLWANLLKTNKEKAARNSLIDAINRNSKQADVYNALMADLFNNIGKEQYNKGDYDAAISSYRKALELKPDFVEAYNNMGIAYIKKGDYDYEAAISSYRKALELKPDRGPYLRQ